MLPVAVTSPAIEHPLQVVIPHTYGTQLCTSADVVDLNCTDLNGTIYEGTINARAIPGHSNPIEIPRNTRFHREWNGTY